MFLTNNRAISTSHYGLVDENVLFAEMAECYFGSNDFHPFVAGELNEAEPEIFELLREIWGPLRELLLQNR